METEPTVHGTALCLNGTGVLIRGASSSGKSRLAYSLLHAEGLSPVPPPGTPSEAPTALIGDDRLVLTEHGGKLNARAAHGLEGMIEVRGIGLVGTLYRPQAMLHMVIDLVPLGAMVRLPEPRMADLQDCSLPAFSIPIGDLTHQQLLTRTAWQIVRDRQGFDDPLPTGLNG